MSSHTSLSDHCKHILNTAIKVIKSGTHGQTDRQTDRWTDGRQTVTLRLPQGRGQNILFWGVYTRVMAIAVALAYSRGRSWDYAPSGVWDPGAKLMVRGSGEGLST